MSTKRKCVYCGQAQNLTNEHLFPEFFQNAFEPITTAKTPTGDKAVRAALEVHDVCAPCNNGPLSQLDTYLSILNDKYFSAIIHSGDSVHFEYDVDMLLRALLKIGFNVARARKWHLHNWQAVAQYILGRIPRPHGMHIYLQLMIPTPLAKTTLPVSPEATEVPPIPMRVELFDVGLYPGAILAFSISVFSYRFFILREDMTVFCNQRQRTIHQWAKHTKGAYELTHRRFRKLYASSVQVLDDPKNSAIFLQQLSKMRRLKQELE